ncbi:hypothetical protein [Arthrobacter sp. ISL-5]|uniref:hypothetical protein n=1 Tax=Arthrobacter sp. ISL-5 TaxID=2819111 RepID=UPI001BE592E8|nr:hypothetical protein [Arthrobacter sp. ISL-5]MBT2551456.1 hypothetical protein [Arthrobacter sp. ISL-5]
MDNALAALAGKQETLSQFLLEDKKAPAQHVRERFLLTVSEAEGECLQNQRAAMAC